MSSPATDVEAKPSLIVFDKKHKAMVTDPMMDNNPITVQVLGIVSLSDAAINLPAVDLYLLAGYTYTIYYFNRPNFYV